MELREYLEIGATKAGSLTALGKLLDMSQPTISNIKAGKRPMPIDAVVKLADYINADLRTLIAANELVTEKKEEKRRFWSTFVERARAAAIALIVTIAGVTTFVTPTPAEAAPILERAPQHFVLCKVWRRKSEKRQLNWRVKFFLESLLAMFQPRLLHVKTV